MKTDLRVLVISSEYPPLRSPESAHTLKFCEELVKVAGKVRLITTERPGIEQSIAGRGYDIVTVARWGWRALTRIGWEIIRFRPNGILLIYLSRSYGFLPAVTFAPALCRLLKPGVAFVSLFENVSDDRLGWSRWMNRLVRVCGKRFVDPVLGRLLKDTTAVISLSPAHIRVLEQSEPAVKSKVHLLPVPPIISVLEDRLGENRSSKRNELGLHDSDILVLYFGYMYRGKGVETLLRAINECLLSGVPVILAIVGGASDESYGREMHALSASLGLGDRVRWVGYCEDLEASRLLRAADICTLPFDQGLRLNNSSFATAAAHGLPVISTYASPQEIQFQHTQNVWLVDPEAPAQLAAAIEHLARNAEIRQKIVQNVIRFAEENFSWDRVVSRTLELMH